MGIPAVGAEVVKTKDDRSLDRELNPFNFQGY